MNKEGEMKNGMNSNLMKSAKKKKKTKLKNY